MSSESPNSLLLFFDQKEFFERLPDPEAKKLIIAIFEYCMEGKHPELEPLTDMAFLAFKGSLDRNIKKRNRIREQRILAGKKSGEARREQNEQVLAKENSLNPLNKDEQKETRSTNAPSISVSRSVSVRSPKPPEGDFAGSGKPRSRLSLSEKKKVRVAENTDLMIRIGGWKKFGRRAGTLWTVYEAESLEMVFGTVHGDGLTADKLDELLLVEKYYNAEIPGKDDYRRNGVSTLLNNWTDAVDRAHQYAAARAPSRDRGVREYGGLD